MLTDDSVRVLSALLDGGLCIKMTKFKNAEMKMEEGTTWCGGVPMDIRDFITLCDGLDELQIAAIEESAK